MTEAKSPSKERVAIILHSGAYDRVSYALCMALAALASGMEVNMLLTCEGLKRFSKGHLTEIGDETPLNMHPIVQQGLEIGSIQPLDEQLADARQLGLKVYACPNAMATFKIPKRDLIEVDDVMGLVTFLGLSKGATTWYI